MFYCVFSKMKLSNYNYIISILKPKIVLVCKVIPLMCFLLHYCNISETFDHFLQSKWSAKEYFL